MTTNDGYPEYHLDDCLARPCVSMKELWFWQDVIADEKERQNFYTITILNNEEIELYLQ